MRRGDVRVGSAEAWDRVERNRDGEIRRARVKEGQNNAGLLILRRRSRGEHSIQNFGMLMVEGRFSFRGLLIFQFFSSLVIWMVVNKVSFRD